MRIVHLTESAGLGGIQVFVRNMVASREPGLEHFVFVRAARSLAAGNLLPEYSAAARGVEIFEHADRAPAGRDVMRFGEVIRSNRIDLIHATSDATHWMAAGARLLGDIPILRSAHAITSPEELFATLLSLRDVTDAVVCDAGPLQRRLAAENISSTVIHPGVDILPDRALARKHRAPLNLGMVAQFLPVKDHATLIDALGLLGAECDWRLTLAGEGPLKDAIRKRCARFGPEQVRILRGQDREEMKILYGEIDLLVLPSRSEVFPLVTQEAMGFGIPVIASRVGGLPEQIEEGVNGFMFEPGDAAGLAACIRRAAEPETYEALSRHAAEKAARDFAFEKTAVQYADLFRKISRARPAEKAD